MQKHPIQKVLHRTSLREYKIAGQWHFYGYLVSRVCPRILHQSLSLACFTKSNRLRPLSGMLYALSHGDQKWREGTRDS